MRLSLAGAGELPPVRRPALCSTALRPTQAGDSRPRGPGLVESWTTSQLSSGGNIQAHRRLTNRPRSRSTLTKTWLRRLKGPWSTVPWAFPTLSTHTVVGAVQPRLGRNSCLREGSPKPLGATIDVARPIGPSKATLAPTPPTEHCSQRMVAGRLGKPDPAHDLAPAPSHGETAEGGLFPEGAVERHTGRQVAAARMGAGGGGQVQDEGFACLTAVTRACGGVWVWASHPESGWRVAA